MTRAWALRQPPDKKKRVAWSFWARRVRGEGKRVRGSLCYGQWKRKKNEGQSATWQQAAGLVRLG